MNIPGYDYYTHKESPAIAMDGYCAFAITFVSFDNIPKVCQEFPALF